MWRYALLAGFLIVAALLAVVPAAPERIALENAYLRAVAHLQRGAFSESLNVVRRVTPAVYQRMDVPWRWRFQLLEAEVLIEQGDLDRAMALLEAEPEATSRFPQIEIERRVLRAKLHLRRAQLDTAAALLEDARALAGTDEMAALRAEIDLLRGQLLARRQQLPQAERAFLLARDSALRAGDSYRQASAANGLGMTRMLGSRCDEALSLFQEALTVWRRLGADRAVVGAANNLGMCYSILGDFDRALEYRKEALALVKPGARLADVLGETGSLYMQQGQPQLAIPYYRRAMEAAKRFGVVAETARWAGNLTSALVAVGDWEGAEKANGEALSLKPESRSLAFLKLNTAAIAAGRGRLDDARQTYENAIASSSGTPAVLWQSHARLAKLLSESDPAGANHHFEAAIRFIEDHRSELNRSEHKITFLSSLIRFYHDYVDALMEQNAPAKALEIADLSRARILAERLSLRLDAPAATRGRDFQDIARRSGSVWLIYWVAPRRSFLWVVTPREIYHFVLPPAAQLAASVEQYQGFIERALRDPLRAESEAGKWLYDSLIRPALSLIPSGSPVIVVPDGPLHQLNFETLPVYGDRPHYWIEDVRVAIAPSLGVFEQPPRSSPNRAVLVIGDPEPAGPEYPKLPHAASEVESLAQRFPGPATKVFTGPAAQPAVYRSARPEHFSILHIAAHAEANRQSPLDSAVILSPGNGGFKLYARDVIDIPLRADLVTISACRSSGARNYAGEGLVGFAWAFLQAGARAVIAGLWDVADQSTSMMMDRMYAQISAGVPPLDALRSAKLELIRSNYSKPYYWGPFQICIR
jgi:CHAT domain-containing protein/Tfp pilus assembly protein PilF